MDTAIPAAFQPISEPVETCCPSCGKWLWRMGAASAFFTRDPAQVFERAADKIADDGDSVRMASPPAPLKDFDCFDTEMLVGTCPHCDERYRFIIASFSSVPVDNGGFKSPSFICDEGYLDFTGTTGANLTGDRLLIHGWTVLRHTALWQGAAIQIDTHLLGPWVDGDELIGPNGVAFCAGNSMWAQAAEMIRTITPAAVRLLEGD